MTIDDTTTAEAADRPSRRRRLWFWVKWTLFALVLLFVTRRGYELWNQEELQQVQIDYGWLLLAGGVYIVGWLPSVWFWQQAMQSLGGSPLFPDAARAYYWGHLGKYIPGKASVLVIRAALMKDRGARPGVAALTSAYETLAMMGVGAVVAAALLPTVVQESQRQNWPNWLQPLLQSPLLMPAAIVTASLLMLPLVSRLFSRIALKMASAEAVDKESVFQIGTRLLTTGFLLFVIAWACHGLSLGFTLRAIGSNPLALSDWPLWTAGVSLATVIGFAALFAPGGLGVREGLLIEVLKNQPAVGTQQAVVAAVLLRLVWLVAEIVIAGTLHYTVRPPGLRRLEKEQ